MPKDIVLASDMIRTGCTPREILASSNLTSVMADLKYIGAHGLCTISNRISRPPIFLHLPQQEHFIAVVHSQHQRIVVLCGRATSSEAILATKVALCARPSEKLPRSAYSMGIFACGKFSSFAKAGMDTSRRSKVSQRENFADCVSPPR